MNPFHELNNQYVATISSLLSSKIIINDLSPYFEIYELGKESVGYRPLLHGNVIVSNEKEFWVDRIIKGNKHCYVFIPTKEFKIRPFARKPSEVKQLIEEKKITVTETEYNYYNNHKND